MNLSPHDVAARLNVPVAIVRNLIATGRLHAAKLSRKTWLVPLWSVEAFEQQEKLFRIPTIRANQRQSV